MIHEYTLSEEIELNQKYTFTIWGELGEGKSGFAPYVGDGNNSLFNGRMPVEISKGVYSITSNSRLVWNTDVLSEKNRLLIYMIPSDKSVTSTIYRIKLERGENHNPIWTPAPADMILTKQDLKAFLDEYYAEKK